MKILYLAYSQQSGVIDSVAREFRERNNEVTICDVCGDFSYRHKQYKMPSLKPHDIFNTTIALFTFRKNWRKDYYRTDYAFKHMSRVAKAYIKANDGNFDAILQSGVLFSPYYPGLQLPFYLYIDHTYNISKNYALHEGEAAFQDASPKWEQMEYLTYHRAEKIFTMSRFVKDSLTNTYGIKENKIVVVGAGPNLHVIPTTTPSPNNKILFVGIDFKRKGGLILLKAFEKVKEEIPNAKLYIVGANINTDQPGVVAVGKVSFDEMPRIYQDAALFVLPTIREPFGLAYLEAMAYGLPCIGTDVEAVPEIIGNHESGFIVKPHDHAELAAKIITLLNNPDLALRMGRAGRQMVLDKFNWPHVCGLILETMAKPESSPADPQKC